ncbi:MAG: beta-N-acetylhexosaminidase [Spirochaetes bacterium]|nr:beta-N-acetylhexosaminidase [Spirochaetota bacterium]
MKKIIIADASPELKEGLSLLTSAVPMTFAKQGDGHIVSFKKDSGLSVAVDGNRITVSYAEKNQAFRALGLINGMLRAGRSVKPFSETQRFSLINVMVDVSRNAALTVETTKDMLRRFALMGINSFMLYTEANYEVPGEPFWGYNTGGYSIKELQELDAYASKLGIEMFPCIQMLAHLRRALQWPAYGGVKDTETVLMVGEEKTYALLDKILGAAMLPYKSKRVHIGMDEAWDLGQGNFLRKNGYKTHFELMRTHLTRVMDIARKHGVKPMMWADMFFRAGSKTGAYYDLDVIVPDDVKAVIPPEMQLVYWDYYHDDEDFYKKFIDRHLELSPNPPVVATGAQTWTRFWTHYEYALSTIDPFMKAAKAKGVKEAIMTVWGDDGNECDYYSFMPVMQYYADHAFNDTVDMKTSAVNLLGSCDITYDDWKTAGTIDRPKNMLSGHLQTNVSKFLLWEDPLFGMLQPIISPSIVNHFTRIADELESAAKKKGAYDSRLAFPAALARVLSVKSDFPRRLQKAYKAKDNAALRVMLKKDIPFLRQSITKLWKIHRAMWMATYKPQGWETIESRYGGLLLRFTTLAERVSAYTAGRIGRIEELEGKRLKIWELPEGRLPTLQHNQSYTATMTPVN